MLWGILVENLVVLDILLIYCNNMGGTGVITPLKQS